MMFWQSKDKMAAAKVFHGMMRVNILKGNSSILKPGIVNDSYVPKVLEMVQ